MRILADHLMCGEDARRQMRCGLSQTLLDMSCTYSIMIIRIVINDFWTRGFSVQRARDRTIRMTKQRTAVLSVLRSTGEHPPADWVYSQVRRILPRISLGTVYRNLSEMRDAGLVLQLDFGEGASRFDFRTDPHYHIFCLKCGKVEDVMIPFRRTVEKAASKATGYKILSHTIQFKGICSSCMAGS